MVIKPGCTGADRVGIMLRIGIIGTGIIASSHADAAVSIPGVKLAAAVDINKDKVDAFAEKYEIVPYCDYKVMIDEQQPDIVIICLPHYLHKESVLYAAEKHVNILVEKPMAINLEECQAMIDASSLGGVKLFVGHIQRYLDFNIITKDIVESVELGMLTGIHETIHTSYFNADRPRWFLKKEFSGGGIAFNLGAHFFDRIQWITGRKVLKVRANVEYGKKEYDIESSAQMFCQLDGGLSASCLLNGCSPVEMHRIEYIFTDGVIEVYPFQKIIVHLATGSREMKIGGLDMFRSQLVKFIACLENGTNPEIDGQYGKRIIRCLKAVYESAAALSEKTISRSIE